ncbi:MAG TPA: carbamoyltransferase N-terminal domain-containing protein, partial [Solidesulfovibrio sp.]|nr:carbamoyltransferase N-terminal domain-containing protein [Solidesulfovibrio sp.]
MAEYILGISAYYHDSAAALLRDGEIVAAAHEERFTRKKHDASFPEHAARYVLEEAGIGLSELASVAFYDKPYLKFERLMETYHGFAPRGVVSFLSAMPVWIKEKLFMKKMLREELVKLGQGKPRILFPEHHLSHAASAFYPSPFDAAAILTIDGVGEWSTTTIGVGRGKDITFLRELDFPHSLGLLYSAFTYYCGFKVNSGEYKLMGLAPYGIDGSERVETYKAKILDELVDLRPDGSLLLNMAYFDYATGLTMCRDAKFEALFGLPKRAAESELAQEHMDMALAIQQVTEDVVMRLARTARELSGEKYLVMAGGVALNCVANGKLLRSGVFDDIWIQPAAGDAGGALGAALA